MVAKVKKTMRKELKQFRKDWEANKDLTPIDKELLEYILISKRGK